MKNLKRFGALALTATMALGVTAFDIAPDVQPVYVPGLADLGIAAISAELPNYQPHFETFTGTVISIEQEGTHVLVENEDGAKVMFVINHNTFFTGEIEVGSIVTGHHIVNPGMAVPAIWPPHNTARVIELVTDSHENVVVDRFTMIDEWTFASENLTLNINENTPVFLQDGDEVYLPDVPGMTLSQMLNGRKLVVTYTLTNRLMSPDELPDIPGVTFSQESNEYRHVTSDELASLRMMTAGTIPGDPTLSVVVLFEEAVHLPGFGLDLGFDSGYGYDYNYTNAITFNEYTGEITAIDTTEYGYKISLTSEEQGSMTFLTNFNTYVNGELAVGQTVTGHYAVSGAMLLIYPPQHTVRFINTLTEVSTTLDRFEVVYGEDYMFESPNLILSINDETPIYLQDGQAVREILEEGQTLAEFLNNRKLVVSYTLTTRSLPAQTIPSDPTLSVTVLFEEAVALDMGMNLDIYMNWAYNYGISVNGRMVDALWQEVDGAFYVPFRAVVNLLGFGGSVDWNAETHQITVSNGTDYIAFSTGSNQFYVNGYAVELSHPAILIEDRAHVPFNFFTEVFGTNNAYMHAGQIFINNEEAMQ